MPRQRITSEQVLQLPQTHQETIPDEYLDDMGHMNVRWYTHLFSCGSAGWMQQIGLNWDAIAEYGGGTFVLESHTRFYAEVMVGQEVAIHARIVARTAKRYHLLLFMRNATLQVVAAVNEVIIAYVDLAQRRQSELPSSVQHELDTWIERHASLNWQAPICGVMRA